MAAGARAFIDCAEVGSGAARSRLTSRAPFALVIGSRPNIKPSARPVPARSNLISSAWGANRRRLLTILL